MASDIQRDIASRIKTLRSEYTSADAAAQINSTEEALRRNIKRAKLAEHEVVQEIAQAAVKAIADISFLLANDETLTSDQRGVLFAEKRVHRFWLERIDGTLAEQSLNAIKQTVDSIALKGGK